MIKKLKNRISIIILLSISIPLLLIVTLYTYSYYNNVVKSTTLLIDRMYGKETRNRENFDISLVDGIYSVTVKNGKVITSSDSSVEEIQNYAIELESKNKTSGIIDNYIYKIRNADKDKEEVMIVFVESKDEITKIKTVIIFSISLSILGIALIYIIANKISRIITKPVEETLLKQIEFISDASHELKTPLAVIRANADVLENETGNNKWLTYIQNEIDNMQKLINELLLLTKIENVDKLRKAEKFDISEHIELIVLAFESMAFEKKVKLNTNIEGNIITESFNKEDIEHILSTLVDNAIKHTDKNNEVIVELKKYKDHINIKVKNQGEEIPINERDKIFERFYRIDKSRNRNEKRYGLGLAIAKSTVLKNNGEIKVDYKEGYTIFSVTLPINRQVI